MKAKVVKRKRVWRHEDGVRVRDVKGSGLTQEEEELLEILVVGARLAAAGFGHQPSQRDILSWMGYSASTNAIKGPLRQLEAMGYIYRDRAGCQSGHGRERAVRVLRVLDGGTVPGSGDSIS